MHEEDDDWDDTFFEDEVPKTVHPSLIPDLDEDTPFDER